MDECNADATYVKELSFVPVAAGAECFGSEQLLGPTHEAMAKNIGESRIPVPRAARPSFFPKSRLGTPTLVPGHRRSLILSGCLQFVDTEDEPTTPNTKCGTRPTSTPTIEDPGHNTFTISPVWDIDKDDVQLVNFAEEKSNFYSLLENSQLNMIEDAGDSCLVDASLGSYNENTSNTTPHYLMLNKQNSFEHDESLGILTPDQMTDFTVALECSRTPSCENLTGSAGSRLALTRASASRPSADVEPTEEVSSERTPSPEELPLDPKPAEPVRVTGVPISFVTSVTSITSLEAGYQGDGENSRPASRGADPPNVVPPPNLPAPCRQDPMTDSDFFTESDADAYEEIVRGDRKAQVIDGTLFCAPGGRRCPSFTGEEMDSSGIYSDLDKRHDELHAPEEAPEENEDRTPDTIDTEVSQRSQPSPAEDVSQVIMDYLQAPVKPMDGSADTSGSMNGTQVTIIEVKTIAERNNDNMRSKAQNKADSVPLKKYKMPKRNVVSKIKAMIESGPKDEAEKEARRSQRSARKGGRWDAVMSKIEAGKNEQRTRPTRKEVKSRVLQSLSQPSSTSSTQKKAGDANNNNNKDKRRIRGRQEMKSPTQETARSSVRSSLSDLSTGLSKDAPKRSPTSANPPRRITNGRASQQNRVNSFETKKNCAEISTINLEKSPSATRKPTTRRTSTVPAKHGSTTSPKDRETKEHTNSYVVTRASLETRDQAAQTDIPYEAFRTKRAEQAVQALSITIQYLAYELDAFNTPKLKKDCEDMKKEWMSTCSELEELRTRNLGIEERLESEREENRRALDQLREDLEARHAEQIAALEAVLQEERRKCELRLRDSLNEAAKEHRAAMVKLRTEQEAEMMRKEVEFKRRSVVYDQGAALTAEVESLRSVLEIRSQENAALRSELDNIRREIEDKEALQQRVDSLEARCEDLKAQLQCKEAFERQISHDNEVLHESIHQISKQNKRLAQRNEELQWRLRQKNEVVTVLANLTPRLSRSLGPEHVEHTLSPDKNGPQSASMVKHMVEKGDSVSWTLEIDDEFSKGANDTSLATPPKMSRPETTTSVSRQGSLRLTPRRPSVDMRARSKSISVTDSARVEESAWSPACNSTPISRRRPRSDPSSSSSSTSSSSSSSSTAVTTNSAVAVAVAAAAAAAAAAEDCNAGQQPQEAGGEAMISEETSATSSEDESSTSSDIPPLPIQFAWGKPIK
ncbi:toucan [Calliopsis andreniformis]|uniref:toucan n=1 Tax=Calliopsis andreniformis TaxID=337506 RepID=UPI003FCC6EB1